MTVERRWSSSALAQLRLPLLVLVTACSWALVFGIVWLVLRAWGAV